MNKRAGETEISSDILQADAAITFIGHIETPFSSLKDCPRNGMKTDEIARIRLKPEFLPGLRSVETCSHIIVLYWMHEAHRTLIQQKPSFANQTHGTFALRSPNRPNPIALSVVECLEMKPDGLTIRHIDCLNGTPLLDIKPYIAASDCVPKAHVGWLEDLRAVGKI